MGDAASSRRRIAQGKGNTNASRATSSRRRRRPQRLHSARAGRSPIVGPRSLLVARAGSNPATGRNFGSIRRIIIAVKSIS